MTGTLFSRNGELLPLGQGSVALDDVNFAYGYGVYETLKVRGGVLFFPERHVERLLHSAAIIGLEHGFAAGQVLAWLADLVRANRTRDANLKVMMIGRSGPGADLYLMELNPLFPKRHDYRHGARAVLFAGERQYPQAKSLNMLVSTMAYRLAQGHGAYDAILVNRHGHLTEGTRTNLFYTDGEQFFTPPSSEVLAGVTRQTVMDCIRGQGWAASERPLTMAELAEKPPAGLFLTSTSTKIMPIGSCLGAGLAGTDDRGHWLPWLPPGKDAAAEAAPGGGGLAAALAIHPRVTGLMKAYDVWLDRYQASQPVLVPADSAGPA
jgi:branched-subunit amino acid aminotransferase/4-amino-4-deoxychorismate lyase